MQTLDTGTEVLFSESSNLLRSDATDMAKQFAWAFNVGVDGISQRIRLGKFARLYYDPQYRKACKVVHDYTDLHVQKAIERARDWHARQSDGKKPDEDERYTFLNALAREGVGAKEIRDQVLNIRKSILTLVGVSADTVTAVVAARDTSACLMSGAFFEMANRPEIQAKLRHEIEMLQGRLPTFEDIKNMKYLNHFIKETLRLHPPIPLNARVACNDTYLPRGGGPDGSSPIFVEKGKLVVYQVYSMHRRPDIWGQNADEFNPDRWETAKPTFEYLPFNAGPRICPGMCTSVSSLTNADHGHRPTIRIDRNELCSHPSLAGVFANRSARQWRAVD
jgi:cytochrome P450